MEKLVSVVVPIYKVEKYLDKCVESIVNQTYKNLEIILVDDGSPDNCPKMCDEWAKKDSRIQVIHKANGGLSDARNFGIEKATGELISFIDSDDYLDVEMIKTLVELMEKYNSDVSIGGFKKVYEDETLANNYEDVKPFEKLYQGQHTFDLLEDFNVGTVVAWGKVYKKEIFSEIRYPVGKIYEDGYVAHKYLHKANSVVITNKPLYMYLQRASSIMGQNSKKVKLSDLDAFRERIDFMKENNIDSQYITNAYCAFLNAIISSYVKAKKQEDIKKELVKFFKDVYKEKKENKGKINFKSKVKFFLFKYFRFVYMIF